MGAMNTAMKSVNVALSVMDMPSTAGLALESRLAARLASGLSRCRAQVEGVDGWV